MFSYALLAIPIYILDEGQNKDSLFWQMFLFGLLLAILGWILEEKIDNIFLGCIFVFVKMVGIGLFLSGLLSGIISLF